VIDRYGPACVVQIGTAGMEQLKSKIQEALSQVLRCEAVLFKNDSSAREMEGLPSYVETAKGNFDKPAVVIEDELEFQAPSGRRPKTGWFFDQAPIGAPCRNTCARAPAFWTCSAMWGRGACARRTHGAREVTCVDSSQAALELAAANAERNGLKVVTLKGDAFDALEDFAKQGARFDIVVIDPPAFAKRKKDLPQGTRGIQASQPARAASNRGRRHSGFLLLLLSRERRRIAGCHCQSGRGALRSTCKFLKWAGQAPDHPVHPAIPETRYPQGLFLSGQ